MWFQFNIKIIFKIRDHDFPLHWQQLFRSDEYFNKCLIIWIVCGHHDTYIGMHIWTNARHPKIHISMSIQFRCGSVLDRSSLLMTIKRKWWKKRKDVDRFQCEWISKKERNNSVWYMYRSFLHSSSSIFSFQLQFIGAAFNLK